MDRGDPCIQAGSRLTDTLNSKNKDFIALIDAKASALDSDVVLYAPLCVAIDRTAITCIFPLE